MHSINLSLYLAFFLSRLLKNPCQQFEDSITAAEHGVLRQVLSQSGNSRRQSVRQNRSPQRSPQTLGNAQPIARKTHQPQHLHDRRRTPLYSQRRLLAPALGRAFKMLRNRTLSRRRARGLASVRCLQIGGRMEGGARGRGGKHQASLLLRRKGLGVQSGNRKPTQHLSHRGVCQAKS